MRVLILGGTQFIGRTVTSQLLAAGHDVTHFNRGSRPGLFPEVNTLIGDRKGSLAALESGEWDSAIDMCGYLPEEVIATANLLKGRIGQYLFISTISVYPFDEPRIWDESAPLYPAVEPVDREITGETYGPLKVLCERALTHAVPDELLILRPGIVVGVNDHTDRFIYYPTRLNQLDDMIAPVGPGEMTQFIDVDDLANFVTLCVEENRRGTYNANGIPVTMGALMNEAGRVTGSKATVHWIPAEWLTEQGLTSLDLPLWRNPNAVTDITKAQAAGLTLTPLALTMDKAWAWASQRPSDYELARAISKERNHELLHLWRG